MRTESTPSSKRAIVLVPGLIESERDEQRDYLVNGLCGVSESMRVDRVGPATVDGASGVRLRATDPRSESTGSVDVFEAYWYDLVHRLSRKPLRTRMVRGTFLLPYWLQGSLLRHFNAHKFLMVNLTLGSLLLILWYVSTVGLLLALGDELIPNVIPFDVPNHGATQPVLERWIKWIKTCVLTPLDTFATTYFAPLWAFVAVLSYLVPVNLLVDVADFSKRYLMNETEDEGSPLGLRDKLRNRVRDTVIPVCESGAYDGVTVVAHSFGCAVAVDVLADLSVPADVDLHLVTMGSPLELLVQRSSWVRHEIRRCASQSSLTAWDDVYSNADWFCTRTPFDDLDVDDSDVDNGDGRPNLRSHRVLMDATLQDKLAVRTHRRYVSSPLVVDTLLRHGAPETTAKTTP